MGEERDKGKKESEKGGEKDLVRGRDIIINR